MTPPADSFNFRQDYFQHADENDTSFWDLSDESIPKSKFSFESSDQEMTGSTDDVSAQPSDGGLRAWLQVAVGFLLVMNSFGYSSSFGIFQGEYETRLNRPSSDLSWIGSLQLFLVSFLGIASGRLIDAGYFTCTIWTGCALQLAGVFLTSFAKRYWQLLLVQGLLHGIGSGLTYTPAVWLVSTHFLDRRAFALGASQLGVPIGGVVFSLVARQLRTQIGFSWTVRIMGFILLFNTIVALSLARPRAASHRRPLVEWSAFREPPYVLFGASMFCAQLGLWFVYYYIPIFAQSMLRLPNSTALTLLIVLSGAGVLGRLIPPYISDRYLGPLPALTTTILACAICILSWSTVRDTRGLIAFTALYGFWSNGLMTLFTAALASLTPDPKTLGTRVGMVITVVSLALLTGPPVAGVLVQASGGSFLGAQIFGGVAMLVGACLAIAAKLAQMKRELECKQIAFERRVDACRLSRTLETFTVSRAFGFTAE